MTDAEINIRLALAIGWSDSDILLRRGDLVGVVTDSGLVRYFDYRDPTVIWPIAERFNAFPLASTSGWFAYCFSEMVVSATAAKAVALAVIKAHKGAKE